jgi:hypothetical protein
MSPACTSARIRPRWPGQHRQRDLRADAADLLHVAEQAALALAQEAVQRHAVFLLRVVGEQEHLAAHVGQVVEGAHRRFQFVADAMHVDHQPRRLLVARMPRRRPIIAPMDF